MSSPGSNTAPNAAAQPGTSLLDADVACERLFDKILDQLAASSLFSNPDHAPDIFIVYAHNNAKKGTAHDECVRKIIKWLRHIHARILSDQTPLPCFDDRIEGDDAIRNILANQLCLLPPKLDSTGTPSVTSVGKVIVCGSVVLERYYRKPSALSYIRDIVHICTTNVDQSASELQASIRARVETESNEDGFHHILTELAFLEVRKSVLSEKHGMIPLAISQINAVGAPMRYLPAFYNTDVKLKLPKAGSLHRLFFKLLEQLFPDDRDFIKYFRDCYDTAGSKLRRGQNQASISWHEFDDIVSREISRAYQEYWSLFCVSVRDGKLRAYSGKLSDRVSKVLRKTELTEQHKILKWLSPISAPELHGRFQDSGTARMEGTCDWVIKDENFRRWYASQDSELLLLRGDMGTGKTYSTSRVVDWIKQGLSTHTNHEAFAYFYCNKQESMRQQAKEILRNIIRQLATGPWRDSGKSEGIHETVHELWETSQGRGISSTFAQWSSCLVSLIETYPRTTIVLDAFDECEQARRQDLIKLFIKLATRHSNSPVKIFISTRPEQDVLQHFDKYPTIRLGEKQNADDIATFVRTKIAEHRRWSKMPEDFQIKVIRTLLAKSGDMFLFASLQIQHLLLCTTQPALEDRLRKIPDSLEETYQEIYQKAAPHRDERKLLDKALKWVMCSARPLNSRALLIAICQDSESEEIIFEQRPDVNEDLILELSQNLLCLGDGTDDSLDKFISGHENHPEPYWETSRAPVWRLAHQAVAEFFENTVNCNSEAAHYEVGKVCLMLLLEACRRNEKKLMILHVDISLVTYAIWAWPMHVRAQEHREARIIAGITKNLREFLGEPEKGSPAYEKWMKYVSMFDARTTPYWSILAIRSVPKIMDGNGFMTPISLACFLGFYNTLAEWWHGYRFDENAAYSAVDWYPPVITWSRGGPPFYLFGQFPSGSLRLRWSLSALACVYDETEILKCLLDRGAHINTEAENEVPPIVVTAMTNSVESAAELLQRGIQLSSSFTRKYGDILHLTLRQDSMDVMELLLSRAFAESMEIESSLNRFSWQLESFRRPESIILLLDRGVDVNTPLFDGTLLAAAAWNGWEDLVRLLLDLGADVNTKFEGLPLEDASDHKTALEASISCPRPPSIPKLLIEKGARVSARDIDLAKRLGAQHDDEEELRQLLEMHGPNRTWKDEKGNNTSVLIEQVKDGHTNEAYILIQDGADVKLEVGGKYQNPISTMFWAALHHERYPLLPMVSLFVNAGVSSFGFLKGDHLNIALASVAYHGLEDRMQYFLDEGASPDAFSAHRWTTALGAAAASGHPQASRIIRMLLDRGAIVNIQFPSSIGNVDEHSHHRFALDCPAFLLLLYAFIGVPVRSKRMHSWLKSMSLLLSNGAIWDIDFTQWRECLGQRAPEFERRNSQSLDQMLQLLTRNRASFFLANPGAASDERWQVKDAKDPSVEPRNVLDEIGRAFME